MPYPKRQFMDDTLKGVMRVYSDKEQFLIQKKIAVLLLVTKLVLHKFGFCMNHVNVLVEHMQAT